MPRELTWKQEAFAAARAMGKSWADSYREAYEPSNPKAMSVYSNAARTRRNPLVARRIAELREHLIPAPVIRGLQQRALAAAVDLAETGEDDKARLGALQLAARELEKSRRLEEESRKPKGEKNPGEERAEIIAELRDLYAKALPRKAEASVGERADDERKLEEILAASDGEEGAPPAESGAEILEEIREVAPPEDVEVLEPSGPRVHYIEEVVSKPGEFPRRTVMRVVRTPSKPAGS
jgi:hypothetical protein